MGEELRKPACVILGIAVSATCLLVNRAIGATGTPLCQQQHVALPPSYRLLYLLHHAKRQGYFVLSQLSLKWQELQTSTPVRSS